MIYAFVFFLMSTSAKKFISDIQGDSTNPEEHSNGSHLPEGLVQGQMNSTEAGTCRFGAQRRMLLADLAYCTSIQQCVFRVHTSKTLDKKKKI